MGFGKGVGFTPKPVAEQTTYLIKGGGGKRTATLTKTNPTYVRTGGGGKKTATLTETNPTYTAEVT